MVKLIEEEEIESQCRELGKWVLPNTYKVSVMEDEYILEICCTT
jgi:hypothetical protein